MPVFDESVVHAGAEGRKAFGRGAAIELAARYFLRGFLLRRVFDLRSPYRHTRLLLVEYICGTLRESALVSRGRTLSRRAVDANRSRLIPGGGRLLFRVSAVVNGGFSCYAMQMLGKPKFAPLSQERKDALHEDARYLLANFGRLTSLAVMHIDAREMLSLLYELREFHRSKVARMID